MSTEHTQAKANEIAIKEYGQHFKTLPHYVQEILFKMGFIEARKELLSLTRNDKERLLYSNLGD